MSVSGWCPFEHDRFWPPSLCHRRPWWYFHDGSSWRGSDRSLWQSALQWESGVGHHLGQEAVVHLLPCPPTLLPSSSQVMVKNLSSIKQDLWQLLNQKHCSYVFFACSALASVGDSRLPNIVLPEVSSNTLMQLEVHSCHLVLYLSITTTLARTCWGVASPSFPH